MGAVFSCCKGVCRKKAEEVKGRRAATISPARSLRRQSATPDLSSTFDPPASAGAEGTLTTEELLERGGVKAGRQDMIPGTNKMNTHHRAAAHSTFEYIDPLHHKKDPQARASSQITDTRKRGKSKDGFHEGRPSSTPATPSTPDASPTTQQRS